LKGGGGGELFMFRRMGCTCIIRGRGRLKGEGGEESCLCSGEWDVHVL